MSPSQLALELLLEQELLLQREASPPSRSSPTSAPFPASEGLHHCGVGRAASDSALAWVPRGPSRTSSAVPAAIGRVHQ
jgi:hypothetical protein